MITLLCTHCWEAARARNEHVPPLARGKAARLTKKERQRMIAGATKELQARQDGADAKWGFLKLPRWDFSPENRTLTFSDQGAPRLVANVRLVGSYSTKSNSFQWSWVLYDEHGQERRGVAEPS